MARDAESQAPPVISPDDFAPILELLHDRQQARGFLTEQDLDELAPIAGTSASELFGAVTAYPRFHLRPDGAAAVCNGPACAAGGAAKVTAALSGSSETACLGLCDQPIAVLTADGPRRAAAAMPATLSEPETPIVRVAVPTSAFFGDDDPLEAAALELTPDEIIRAVADSGLRGRGGAGFPTGRKWQAVCDAPGDTKYVVCNADESEPGTFKDRQILDHQPRRLLAGMIIAGRAVGAEVGVVYLRYEYQSQWRKLLREIEALRGNGLLGRGFDIVVRRGAGSYVCGEETALLSSLEGKRPVPRDRPPYPTTAGLFGKPTLIQNVETLAAVPAILTRGAQWYRDAGFPKLYCVSGDVQAPGVFELPMTVTARELVERAGGDVDGMRAFTLGGLSGGLLPPSRLDLRLDFDAVRESGAHLGSGAMIVVGGERCLTRFVRDALRFFADESCGKCFPCRIGVHRLHEQLDTASRLEAVSDADLRDIVEVLGTGSACGLGSAAGLIVDNLLDDFADELAEHVAGRCPSNVCGAES
ncbi:MAG: NADH-ubiquinone oxidoreductase-F iron-sulfur binding region domain-containing protein [Myxococcota bacterium]